jgi:hypothetical protein
VDLLFKPLLAAAVAACCALGAVAAWQYSQAVTARSERDKVKAVFDAYKLQAVTDALQAAEKARAEERLVQKQQQEALNAAHLNLVQARRDADSSRSALGRMQQRAQATAALGHCKAADPGPTQDGPAASNPAGLLADVLGQLGEEARRYAEIADAARISGQLCEAHYDALIVNVSSE